MLENRLHRYTFDQSDLGATKYRHGEGDASEGIKL